MTTVRNLEERTPFVGSIQISGFEAILMTINENAAKGESTDVMDMASKLRMRIIESCGYDYPLEHLSNVLELWLISMGQRVPE